MNSFVFVMSVGCQYIDMYLSLKDTIDEPMLLRNLSTPTISRLTFQRLWVSQARLWMTTKFFNKATGFLKGFWLALCKAGQILFRSIGKFNLINHSLTVLSEWLSLHQATKRNIRLYLFAAQIRQVLHRTPPLSSKWGRSFLSPTSWHIGSDASSAVRYRQWLQYSAKVRYSWCSTLLLSYIYIE